MLSTSQLREAWGSDICSRCPLAGFKLYDGTKVTVNKRILAALAALDEVLERHRYVIHPEQTGGYNCRAITGGTKPSLHSYGIAVDVNWLINPRVRPLRTDMPRAMIDEILAIRTSNGKQAWQWGGDFGGSTIPDPMHFQIVVTQEDLASGARSGIRAEPAGDSHPTKPPQEDTAMIVQHPRGEFEMFDVSDGALTHDLQLEPMGAKWSGWSVLNKDHAYMKLRGAVRGDDGNINVVANALDGDWFLWFDEAKHEWQGPVQVG
jgi:hypothetical protein